MFKISSLIVSPQFAELYSFLYFFILLFNVINLEVRSTEGDVSQLVHDEIRSHSNAESRQYSTKHPPNNWLHIAALKPSRRNCNNHAVQSINSFHS